MKDKKLCVVVPVHKAFLSEEETLSLKACYEHLNKYDCFLLHPKEMNVEHYVSIHPDLILMPVDPSWLSSTKSYNEMKMSLAFYQLFGQYNYLLTYELDAFIFHSRFDECNAFDFDFIGAPLFNNYTKANRDAAFTKGCNSGFSMRNIQSCIAVLRQKKKLYIKWRIARFFIVNSSLLRNYLKRENWQKQTLFYSHQLTDFFKKKYFHEDIIWTQMVPLQFPQFKVADTASAAKFSFELNPERLFILNHYQLPLGCHAWRKHYDFWKDFI